MRSAALRRLHRAQRRRLRPAREAAEVRLDQRQHLGRPHVAHERDDMLAGHVVALEERLRVGGREGVEVGGPADDGLPVGVGGEGRGQELLHDPARRGWLSVRIRRSSMTTSRSL